MAGSISYTRQWSHKDWIDFVDSVQAGGGNGINIRMHGIENEFDAISNVISLIATALQTPTIRQQTLTLAPTLAPTTASPWLQMLAVVTTPTTGTPSPTAMAASAAGFMPVNLPNGATIHGLRVTGASAGGILTVTLFSQPLTGGNQATVVQVFNTFPAVAAATPFDIPPAPQNANVIVDNTTQKYYLEAVLGAGNTSLAAGGTSLNAFQIAYSSV